jgi:hypothetical protein
MHSEDGGLVEHFLIQVQVLRLAPSSIVPATETPLHSQTLLRPTL